MIRDRLDSPRLTVGPIKIRHEMSLELAGLDAAEIDCEGTSEIVCPWCGVEYMDSFEMGGYHNNDGEDKCESCEKPFRWSRNITVDYSTERIESGEKA